VLQHDFRTAVVCSCRTGTAPVYSRLANTRSEAAAPPHAPPSPRPDTAGPRHLRRTRAVARDMEERRVVGVAAPRHFARGGERGYAGKCSGQPHAAQRPPKIGRRSHSYASRAVPHVAQGTCRYLRPRLNLDAGPWEACYHAALAGTGPAATNGRYPPDPGTRRSGGPEPMWQPLQLPGTSHDPEGPLRRGALTEPAPRPISADRKRPAEHP
jgi:hypothetical protein